MSDRGGSVTIVIRRSNRRGPLALDDRLGDGRVVGAVARHASASPRLRSSAGGRRHSGELQKQDRPEGTVAALLIAKSRHVIGPRRDACLGRAGAAWLVPRIAPASCQIRYGKQPRTLSSRVVADSQRATCAMRPKFSAIRLSESNRRHHDFWEWCAQHDSQGRRNEPGRTRKVLQIGGSPVGRPVARYP